MSSNIFQSEDRPIPANLPQLFAVLGARNVSEEHGEIEEATHVRT